jgi:hypothetical protein
LGGITLPKFSIDGQVSYTQRLVNVRTRNLAVILEHIRKRTTDGCCNLAGVRGVSSPFVRRITRAIGMRNRIDDVLTPAATISRRKMRSSMRIDHRQCLSRRAPAGNPPIRQAPFCPALTNSTNFAAGIEAALRIRLGSFHVVGTTPVA